MITDRRLYLTLDKSRVVEHGSPDAAWLLAPAGREIPDDDARRLGLLKESTPRSTKEIQPAENKSAVRRIVKAAKKRVRRKAK